MGLLIIGRMVYTVSSSSSPGFSVYHFTVNCNEYPDANLGFSEVSGDHRLPSESINSS